MLAMARFWSFLALGAAFRHGEELPDDWQPPRTPRRSSARNDTEGLSMIEAAAEKCENEFVETGVTLGAGTYGTVKKVQAEKTWWDWFMKSEHYGSLDSKPKYFAMKEPKKSKHALAAAKEEIDVMRAARQFGCEMVMPLIDDNPCVDGRRRKDAIVTKLLPWDLKKWKAEHGANAKCYDKVFNAVKQGLDCMHASGYIHGDVKDDNVLFEAIDDNGCPTGISLADFGLSAKLDSESKDFFDAEDYMGAYYMPSSVFVGQEDIMGITKKRGKELVYLASAKLDDCMLAFMMYVLFKKKDVSLQEELGKGFCGKMGSGRRVKLP